MTILGIGLLLLAAGLFVALFRRTHVPDVLLLIVIGLLLGPATHAVRPADFGKAGAALSTIALTVLLFDSGLSLSLAALRGSIATTSRLTVLAFLMTSGVFAACGHLALGLPWSLALSLGAVLGGTSSAVVIPMVQQLGLEQDAGTALVLESALTDVLAIVLAGAFLAAHVSGETNPGAVAAAVGGSFGWAAAIGCAVALLFLLLVDLVRRMPNPTVGVVAIVLVTYGVADYAGASGAIAVLALGFVLRNALSFGVARLPMMAHVASLQETPYVQAFLSDLIFILKTFFFVYLGISVRFADWRLSALALATVLVAYAGRAAVVRLVVPRSTRRFDASVMAVMGPKGLAAAVLAGVPLQRGVEHGEVMQQFTYLVVLASIAVTSLAVPMIERGPVGAAFRRLFRGHGVAES